MATDCLYTTVRNISGATRYFDYLPPHGRRLTDDEELSVPGELLPWLNGNLRKMRGLASDLDGGYLAVVETPQQHVHVVGEDGDLDVFRTVTIHRDPTTGEDEVVAVAPCWEADADASPSP